MTIVGNGTSRGDRSSVDSCIADMRVAYVSTDAPEDPHSLSGTTRSIGLALSEVCSHVAYVSPLVQCCSLIDRAANVVARCLGTKSRLTVHRWRNVNAVARQAEARLKQLEVDCILAPSCIPIAALEDSRPFYMYSDATVPGICGYYAAWNNVLPSSYHEAMAVEKAALRRCRKVFLASEWARASAIEAYGLDPATVFAVPRGANVDHPPSGEELTRASALRTGSALRLLVVGREWYRKGMDVACETVEILRQRSIHASLTIVGCSPPRGIQVPGYVKIFPFLSRQHATESARLRQCFLEATLFLLPTRAEAMGIVLAEAAAFGLPAVARDTGGTSAAVVHEQTGMLVPEAGGPLEFADAVERVVASRETYEGLAVNARFRFEHVLSWPACIRRIASEMARP